MTTRSRRRYIRAQMKQTGESYTKTLRKLPTQASASEEHHAVAKLTNPNVLCGVRLTLTRSDVSENGSVDGVVISSVQSGTSGFRWRVALLSSFEGTPAGGVIEIADDETWNLQPSLAEVAAAAARHDGRCPDGRPRYQPDQVPGGVLATGPELHRMLLKPCLGQPPIATKKVYRQPDKLLYAIADAEPKQARTPAEERRWQRERTCADCGTTSTFVFRTADDGKRYCEKHRTDADRRAEQQRAEDTRVRAVLKAREIVDDPDTVLVAMMWDRELQGYPFRMETFGGELVLERVLPYIAGAALLSTTVDDLPSWVSDSQNLACVGKRLIEAPEADPMGAFRKLLRAGGQVFADGDLTPRDADNLVGLYRAFIGDPDASAGHDMPTVSWKKSTRTAVDVIDGVRDVLREMAAVPLTDDEIKLAKRPNRVRRSKRYRFYESRRSILAIRQDDRRLAARIYNDATGHGAEQAKLGG